MFSATDRAASALWEMTSTSDSPEGCSAQSQEKCSLGRLSLYEHCRVCQH